MTIQTNNLEVEWATLSYEEKSKRNMEYINKIKIEDLKIIEANFDYSEKNGKDGKIGLVTCKTCGKTYSWSEWGRVRSRSLKMAGKHIAMKHKVGDYDFCSPIKWSYVFKEWTDKKADAIELIDIENAPNFKVGDKVVDSDGDNGVVIEIVDKNHKESYMIDKNHKVILIVQQEGKNTRMFCRVTELRSARE